MKMELPDIRPEDRTPLVEGLLDIIRQLLDRVQQLEQTNQQLRDEIALLKGQKSRPEIKPSNLESKPKQTAGPEVTQPRPKKGPKNSQLTIHHEVKLYPKELSSGATFKGFEPYVVQGLLIQSDNTKVSACSL
jgi:hypothetical protein